MRGFIIGTAATAITFAVVAYLLPQIDYGDNLPGLIVLAIIAGVVNGFIKPVVKILSLPLTMVSFGLFGLVINAALLLLIAWAADLVHVTFTVGDFPPKLLTARHDRRGGDRRYRDQHRRDDRRTRGPRLNDPDRLPDIADALRAAARRFGTPAYVTDLATLDAACDAVREAFPDPIVRQFSVKANDVPAVIAAVAARGFGANVVSRGEWAQARRAGVPNERITLEGIGKTQADLGAAVRAARDGSPLAWVALESVDETAALARTARRAGAPPIDVLYRVNPDVTPETLVGLAVGAGGSKFGMTESEIGEAIEAGGGPEGILRPRGIHLHVGSQLGAVDAWREGVRKALALAALWRGSIETFDTVDLGGGFPVRPLGEPSPAPARFARELPDLARGDPRGPAPDTAGDRTRAGAGRAGRLARRGGAPRP